MLTFFRLNSLFHIFSLLFLVVIVKLPFFGEKLPLLLPELEWMLVGEKIHKGSFLYKEVWTNVGPFSALVYWAIDASFGKVQYIYEFIAILVVYFQALYFTFVCNTRQTFLEKNYAPGLIYVLLMSLSFDMSKLSPVLLSTTFLLFAFNKLIKQMERREGVSDEVFEVGLYIGIAALFHQPSLIFIPWSIASLIFFTNANLRQHFLALLGFILPLFLTGLYFYFYNSLDEFKYNWFSGIFKIKQYSLEDFKSALIAITVPSALTILGFLRQTRVSRYNSYQQRTQQIMLIWGITALLALFLSPNVAPMQFIILVPCFAFFITGFFLHVKGAFMPEILFTVLFIFIVFFQFQGVTPLFGKGFEQLADMRVKPQELPELMKGQKMLVIGERIDEYRFGESATCYLNWDLSKIDLENPDNYESIINIFDNFKKDPPTIIIDKQNVIPKIFMRIPALASDYKSTNLKGIYQRKF
ncbi:hypothetical protein EMA8858_01435 [Emticicia aquatica]|uniref:Glycosyltransferase RgtA/B/C/D-like domain-containing protein n=1 Tax=Emticicia aquatica TaxID=1681835 RepID=A0ABN8EUM7_9BACT|nr:hypothetical protein [Emticicia aquatica]CAH0995314.1 hypothetical protein EMA8858_01435 [Emticicia aquatica]